MKHLRFGFGSWLGTATTSVLTAAAFASMGDIAWSRVYIAACLWLIVLTVVGMIYFAAAVVKESRR